MMEKNRNREIAIIIVVALLITAIVVLSMITYFYGVANETFTEVIEDLYPETLIVIEADHEKQYFMMEDANGFKYMVYEDPEDIEVGDVISAIMKRTENGPYYNSSIFKMQYSGFLANEVRRAS